MPAHKLCIQCDPRCFVGLVLKLRRLGTVTADEAANIMWFEGALSACSAEALPEVVRAIEYIRPRWSDVLDEPVRQACVRIGNGASVDD